MNQKMRQKMSNIFPYFDKRPNIDKAAFIAPTAAIIGDVTIGANSGIWFNSVLRGDVEKIIIGNNTNIQDGSVIHDSRNGFPTKIGSYVTVGHKVLLQACTLEDYSFVGMGSIVMDRAIVESGGWVAAGSLVTEGKIIKSGEIWAGSPAKFFRKLTPAEQEWITTSANNYSKHAQEYLSMKL
jgi:carbonic anhydrase/acetyltransferase-like protein (isoleucine patch superfamily)